MKKEYISPELEVVSLSMKDVLTASEASEYVPQPEVPTRAGNEGLDDL